MIDKYGYEGLDAAAMKEAVESVRGFDFWDHMAKLDVTPTSHFLNWGIKMVQREGSELVPISDWLTVPPLTAEEQTVDYYK